MDKVHIITTLITSATTLGALWFGKVIEHRLAKKAPDLSSPEIEDVILPVLDRVRHEISAFRVDYWEGSNGEKTLSGYHIKKLSMFAESLGQDKAGHEVPSIKDECRLLPIYMFSRNLNRLRDTDKYIVSHEVDYTDDLAAWYENYGIKTVVIFKVKTSNRWTGMLTVSFEDCTELSHSDLVWIESQVGRLGNLVSKV